MVMSSNWAPGQPPANGLAPDTTRRSLTLYGPGRACRSLTSFGLAPAIAGNDALASSSTLPSNVEPTVRNNLDLIAHLPRASSPNRGQRPRRAARGGAPAHAMAGPRVVPGAGVCFM